MKLNLSVFSINALTEIAHIHQISIALIPAKIKNSSVSYFDCEAHGFAIPL
jgi:hypothetical protein